MDTVESDQLAAFPLGWLFGHKVHQLCFGCFDGYTKGIESL